MRCAVLGRPIHHSLSPALHLAAYRELGLDWTYDRYDVGETELADFVAACGPEWRGLSLTMPLKVAALELGEPDPVALRVRAANTLIFEADGSRRVHNTDVEGLVVALHRIGVRTVEHVNLVGSGATARSAVASLPALGTRHLTLIARNAERAGPVAEFATGLGLEVDTRGFDQPLPAADLLIATVAAGAIEADQADRFAASAPIVFDAIYDPWPTPLAAAADELGRLVVNGLDLLVGQAVVQLRLMTGQDVDPAVLYAAGRAALALRPA